MRAAKSKFYWLPFNPSAWRSDPKLRACSLAARGLWIEMLGLMWEASPRGYLRINGRALDRNEISFQVGATSKQVTKALSELHRNDVYSVDDSGVIFSRRMVREAHRSAVNGANGRAGAAARWDDESDGDGHGESHGETDSQSMAKEERRKKKEETVHAASSEESSLDALFDRFWATWPPPRKNRRKARECWGKLRPTPDEEFTERVIAALERHKRSRDWQKDGGRFVPLPTTWINGERWNDELESGPVAEMSGRVVADADETARLLAEHRQAGGRS